MYQYTNLDKSMDGLIIGPISNKELHVFIFNLGRRRSDIFHPHVAHLLLNRTKMKQIYLYPLPVLSNSQQINLLVSQSLVRACHTIQSDKGWNSITQPIKCQSYKIVFHLINVEYILFFLQRTEPWVFAWSGK